MDETLWLIVIGFWFICAIAAGWLSQSRHLDGSAASWFLTGFILGPIGVAWALLKRPPVATPFVGQPTLLPRPTVALPVEEYQATLGEAVPIEDGAGNPLGTVTVLPAVSSGVAA